ncbi:MAG: AAA family ATPase [Lachnospiraceae bacterium]|nr:AAA family ATPase [Lachnospiraceae bacterium]
MIIRVSVENFKSFDSNAELTMISSAKIQDHKNHRIGVKSTNILKHAAIYGANAAGKSNIVDFFDLFKSTIEKDIPIWAAECYCKNKEENKTAKSNFEIQFTLADKFYAYGFSAVLNERKIKNEWLYELFQDGTSRRLFEREAGKRPFLGEKVRLDSDERKRFDVYAEDFESNDTTLFLNEMNRGKKYQEGSKLLFFRDVYHWFLDNLYVIRPGTPLMDFEYYYDEDFLDIINKLIQTFDTGISEVTVQEITLEELEHSIPQSIFHRVMRDIQEKVGEGEKMQGTLRSQNSIFSIAVDENKELSIKTIRFHHRESFYDFQFGEESDGTRRLFDLIDILLNVRNDIVYVVDELERSLHPKLTEHYLKIYMQFHDGLRNQLIFMTHEASIMDQSLFRRDEIWFVERDEHNSSKIYSLDRFKERYDKKIEKAYLEGRYGAIPVFSEFKYGEE